MAVIGLKWSIILNAARDATAMAHRTANTTSSLAWGLRRSKTRKKGTIVYKMISTLAR